MTTETTHKPDGRIVRTAAIVGPIVFTAAIAFFAFAGPDAGGVIQAIAPFWLTTMLVAVATYATGSWMGTRSATAEAIVEDKATATA